MPSASAIQHISRQLARASEIQRPTQCVTAPRILITRQILQEGGAVSCVMPIARETEESCPRCGANDNTWSFKKPEGSVTKICHTCQNCGCEWTEIE